MSSYDVMRFSASLCYFQQCALESRKGGTGGGGLVYPQGVSSKAASGFGCRKALVRTVQSPFFSYMYMYTKLAPARSFDCKFIKWWVSGGHVFA